MKVQETTDARLIRKEFEGRLALLVQRDLTNDERDMIHINMQKYVSVQRSSKETGQKEHIANLETKLKSLSS